MEKETAGSAEALLSAIATGDRRAFADLYRTIGPVLYGICIKMMRHRDKADDVFQDAVVKIWTKAHLFDPAKGQALAWAVTVTRRCALDHLRAQGIRTISLDETDIEITGHVGDRDGAGSSDLWRCLGKLDVNYRSAIVLAFVYGMSHRELTKTLGKPLGTVKSWVRRGLSRLKECLDR